MTGYESKRVAAQYEIGSLVNQLIFIAVVIILGVLI